MKLFFAKCRVTLFFFYMMHFLFLSLFHTFYLALLCLVFLMDGIWILIPLCMDKKIPCWKFRLFPVQECQNNEQKGSYDLYLNAMLVLKVALDVFECLLCFLILRFWPSFSLLDSSRHWHILGWLGGFGVPPLQLFLSNFCNHLLVSGSGHY